MCSVRTVCVCGSSGSGRVRCVAPLWWRLLAAGKMEPPQPTFRSTEPHSDGGDNDLLNLHLDELLLLLRSCNRQSLHIPFVFLFCVQSCIFYFCVCAFVLLLVLCFIFKLIYLNKDISENKILNENL